MSKKEEKEIKKVNKIKINQEICGAETYIFGNVYGAQIIHNCVQTKALSDVIIIFFAVLGISPKSGADWTSALLLSIAPDPRQRNFGIH